MSLLWFLKIDKNKYYTFWNWNKNRPSFFNCKKCAKIGFVEMWIERTAHAPSYTLYQFSPAFSLDSISRLQGEREKFITRAVLTHYTKKRTLYIFALIVLSLPIYPRLRTDLLRLLQRLVGWYKRGINPMQVQFSLTISKLEREGKPIKDSILFLKQVNHWSEYTICFYYESSNIQVYSNFF